MMFAPGVPPSATDARAMAGLERRVRALEAMYAVPPLAVSRGVGGSPVLMLSTGVFGVLIGELDEDLDFEAEATVSVWRWDGSAYVDSGDNVEAACYLLETGETIASGTKVDLAWDGRSGRYEIINQRCP